MEAVGADDLGGVVHLHGYCGVRSACLISVACARRPLSASGHQHQGRQETENLVGYSDFVEAVDNGHDLQECLQISHLHPDSIVLDEDIQEPFLLCRAKVTKFQEQALLQNH